MFPAKKGRLSWQEALKFINKCPVCGSAYAPEQARLFAQKSKANLVHISCAVCRGNFIALVIVMKSGLSTVGMVSDLNFDDARRLHAFSPLEIDELIDHRNSVNTGNILLKIIHENN